MPQHKIIEKYFFFGLLLLVIVFSVFIFKPFLAIIALSGALSVVLYPLFLWINKHIAHGIRWLSSLVTVLVFVIVLCGPSAVSTPVTSNHKGILAAFTCASRGLDSRGQFSKSYQK
jgi:predicted PurR-regulated permease PerM